MPNLSIKNVPEHIVEKLRQRAATHHRSLQGELMDLICRSADENPTDADASRTTSTEKEGESSGWLSIDEIAADLAISPRRSSRNVPLAVDIFRQERNSR